MVTISVDAVARMFLSKADTNKSGSISKSDKSDLAIGLRRVAELDKLGDPGLGVISLNEIRAYVKKFAGKDGRISPNELAAIRKSIMSAVPKHHEAKPKHIGDIIGENIGKKFDKELKPNIDEKRTGNIR